MALSEVLQRQALIGLVSIAMAQQQQGPTLKSGAIEGPKTESQPGSKKTKAPMKQRGTLPAVPLSKKSDGNAVCNKTSKTKEEAVMERGTRAGAIYTSTPSLAPSCPSPPPYPDMSGELEPEDDIRVTEALYSVIGDIKETV